MGAVKAYCSQAQKLVHVHYRISCLAASSFDLDLLALPKMSTVELKACLGFVPSRTSNCLTRSGVVTRLIQGHFVFSRLLQETSHMAGQARILTPVSASWERSKPICSQAQKLVHVHYRISCLAASSFDLDLLALPKMSTVELKACLGFVPSRTSICLTRSGVVTRLIQGHFVFSRLLTPVSASWERSKPICTTSPNGW